VTEAVHRCTKQLITSVRGCDHTDNVHVFHISKTYVSKLPFKNVHYDNHPPQAWLWKLHVDNSSFDTHNTSSGNYRGKHVLLTTHPHHLSTILPDPPLSVMHTVTLQQIFTRHHTALLWHTICSIHTWCL